MNSKQKKQLYRHFKKCVEKWVNFFGLTEYRIDIDYSELDNGCYADVFTNCQGAYAVITLYFPQFEGDDDKIFEQAEKTAFHEVCHLLLARVMTAAKTRFLSPDNLEESEEMIIRRLENTVYPLLKKEKMIL